MAGKQKSGKLYNICRKISYIVLIPFLILIIFSLMLTFSAKGNNGMPNMFGSHAIQLKEDSMLPDYKKGDVVLIKEAKISDLKVGDLIAYYEFLGANQSNKDYSDIHFNVIVAVEELKNPTDQHNGKLFFQMQGTNSDFPEEGWIMEDFVVGKLLSHNGFMENLYVFASSTMGMIVLAVLPSVILIGLLIVTIIGYIKENKRAENEAEQEMQLKLARASEADELAEKEKVVEEKSKKDDEKQENPKELEKTGSAKTEEIKEKSVDKQPKTKVPSVPPKAPPARPLPEKNKEQQGNEQKAKVEEKVETKIPAAPKLQPKAPPSMPKPPAPPKAPPKKQ